MRRLPRPISRLVLAAASAGALTLGATGAASAAQGHAALFSQPSAVGALGPWVIVTDRGSSSLTVLRAANGALVKRVAATALRIASPDAIVTATIAKRRVAFIAGIGGTVAELAFAQSGAALLVTRVRTLVATGCTAALSHLTFDKGHVFEACASGTVTEWNAATGMLVRQFGQNVTGLTDATALAVLGTNVYVTNDATAAPHLAADGIVELSLVTAKRVRTATNATNPKLALDSPSGIASDGTHLWVTNTEADTVDELAAGSLAFVQSSSTNLYDPGAIVASGAYVWVSSVDGPVSSMVTQFTVASPTESPWMMCNTNDAYKFDNPSGFALSAGTLWVTNAADNLVDHMHATSGLLIKTYS